MRVSTSIVTCAALSVCAAPALAGYISGFDDLMGDADGINLTGQDNYYLPNTTSTDFEVYTYAANALRLPQNSRGGTQFIAGIGQADGNFERAQRDIAFTDSVWSLSFDVAVTYTGTGPSAQNIGSVSLQPSGTGQQTFIALATWSDPDVPVAWNADFIYFDAGGNQINSQVPDPAFQNLPIDTWFGYEVVFDFVTNRILEINAEDIDSGNTVTYAPTDWYMEGGAAGGNLPSSFRFFSGSGSAAGNTMAFDNISIVPAPASLALLGLGCIVVRRRR